MFTFLKLVGFRYGYVAFVKPDEKVLGLIVTSSLKEGMGVKKGK